MRKILVCEDESAIRDFVVINLIRGGYEVIEAENGETALKKYDENNGDIDVALLDVMMPGMDGFQVCKELRRRNGDIGIIMLTAKTQPASFWRASIRSTGELRSHSQGLRTTLRRSSSQATLHLICATALCSKTAK